jgi:putative glycerol kinase 5
MINNINNDNIFFTCRCHIYNKLAQIVGQSSSPIEMIYPKQGWAEFSPDQLWESFVSCVKQALKG